MHIMMMIIAIIYILFILCDIWSTVENCFQKILSPPLTKSPSPLFSHSTLKRLHTQVKTINCHIKGLWWTLLVVRLSSQKKKKVHISDKVCCYLETFKTNQEEAKGYIKNILSPGQLLPPVTYDCLVTLLNQKHFGFLNQYAADSSLLYQEICNLIWYISPHEEKFKLHGSSPPKFFEHYFYSATQLGVKMPFVN